MMKCYSAKRTTKTSVTAHRTTNSPPPAPVEPEPCHGHETLSVLSLTLLAEIGNTGRLTQCTPRARVWSRRSLESERFLGTGSSHDASICEPAQRCLCAGDMKVGVIGRCRVLGRKRSPPCLSFGRVSRMILCIMCACRSFCPCKADSCVDSSISRKQETACLLTVMSCFQLRSCHESLFSRTRCAALSANEPCFLRFACTIRELCEDSVNLSPKCDLSHPVFRETRSVNHAPGVISTPPHAQRKGGEDVLLGQMPEKRRASLLVNAANLSLVHVALFKFSCGIRGLARMRPEVPLSRALAIRATTDMSSRRSVALNSDTMPCFIRS